MRPQSAVQLSLPSGDAGAGRRAGRRAERRPGDASRNCPWLPNAGRGKFNRRFTFDQFVVGASNRLAFQASQALARDDTFYNRILF